MDDRAESGGQQTNEACTHLREHGFSVLGDHGALIAVEGDKVVVEGLLWVLQHVVQLSGATFKYTSEVPRNQRPANCFKTRRQKEERSGVVSQVDRGHVCHAFYLQVLYKVF